MMIVYMHLDMYLCMCVFVQGMHCLYVCMCACMYVCVGAMYACVCMHACMCAMAMLEEMMGKKRAHGKICAEKEGGHV
jgi:hypothetical protein